MIPIEEVRAEVYRIFRVASDRVAASPADYHPIGAAARFDANKVLQREISARRASLGDRRVASVAVLSEEIHTLSAMADNARRMLRDPPTTEAPVPYVRSMTPSDFELRAAAIKSGSESSAPPPALSASGTHAPEGQDENSEASAHDPTLPGGSTR